MTTTTTNKMYPGMGCSATEFFLANDEMRIIQNSKILPFVKSLWYSTDSSRSHQRRFKCKASASRYAQLQR
jgi:hypothetical protein